MQLSAAGRKMIEGFEGLILHTYKDAVGILTIGYGITGEEARPGRKITEAEADAMLSQKIADEYEPGVNKLIGRAPTTQNQFDAMLSLAFNTGLGEWRKGVQNHYDSGGFEDSSVLRYHLAGNYEAAATAFLLWNRAGGRVLAPLSRRRSVEAALYLSAAPALSPPVMASSTERARALQDFLNEGGQSIAADGIFGPRSRAALDRYLAGK